MTDRTVRTGISKAGSGLLLLWVGCVLPLAAATIEKMTLAEMAQKSTEIVRARVVSQSAEQRNGIVYTRSRLSVSERWKGVTAATVEVAIPGGKLGGLQQTFSGAPTLDPGSEYVLFLWTGKNGVTQVIGLSQGVFQMDLTAKANPKVTRGAAEATMLDTGGRVVADRPVSMTLADLDRQIRAALGAQPRGATK